MSDPKQLVDKLWNYCNILRDDGLSYGDYVEQLTYLLFLKMADEQAKPPFNRDSVVPGGVDWASLLRLDGDDLEVHYRHVLAELGRQPGLLGIVFRKAQNRIQDPAKLRRLIVDLIDREQWMTLDADVKGDAYEGLLEKNAADTKSGAGQYFTPRPLIRAMVEVMRPDPDMAISDPACGTGGFFLAAYEYIVNHHKLDPDQRRHLRSGAFTGWEIVDNTARLCVLRLGVSRVAFHRLTFGLVPNLSLADDIGMAYIIERNDRYYVVAYDGNDPRTGKERRRWHPAGTSREDAEAIAARLSAERQGARDRMTSALRVEHYLLEVWLPRRKRELRPSTARRYQWYVENYITPAIGAHRLACLRAEHLDRMYNDLLANGGRDGGALSAKTVYDVHVVMRSSLRFAVDRHLVDHNVAADARPPRISTRSRPSPEIWTAQQLASFLAHTAQLRLYPAIHLAATTGMRRGEIVGLRWGDWHIDTHRLSIARSRQSIQGGTVEVPTKTAASRRSIDLDANTEHVLTRWRRRQQRDGHPVGVHDPIFTNEHGKPVNPESISQLFDRKTLSSGLPRIRLHDLRHTHASLLVAAGEPIKVVSERLGHAHPGFTMATYQHLLPGMGAAAATNFAALLTTAGGQCDPADSTKRRVVVGRRSTGAASQTPRSTTRGRAIR